MAIPRVFISSTFYDLKHVRADIDRFIRDIGYEPIRHETGNIAYSKEEALEKSAYKEIEICDIIVCIVGGRFGTESNDGTGNSITQNELRKAIEKGIQVYIFVETPVANEYETYCINKDNTKTKYRHVDDIRIYEYLEQLHALPKKNNPIVKFETSQDIIDYLRIQFAGLFQRFLGDQKRLSEINVLAEMKTIASTLQQLVKFLSEERKNKDDAIRQIILANHPAFRRFATLTNTNYRVYFTNIDELNSWLKARSYKQADKDKYDGDSIYEWSGNEGYIKVTVDIFNEDGSLKPYSESDWDNDWIIYNKYATEAGDDESNEPPF